MLVGQGETISWLRARAILWLTAAAAVTMPVHGFGQYTYPPGDPCASLPTQGSYNGYVYRLSPEQQAQACQQARAVARQRQQAEAAAAQAKAAEEQRAADRARAITAARAAAETAPDNLCREPTTAGILIENYNDFDWEGWPKRRVVDIEHLVTLPKTDPNVYLICHGIWVHTNGARIEGTMTLRLNVAGKTLINWKQEGWTPVVPDLAPSIIAGSPPTAVQPSTTALAFDQGLTDRKAWEEWYNSTRGDYRTGATYWSAQRSLPRPGSCEALGGEATTGCVAAQARLSASDVRRKTEPSYRAGWNSYQPGG